VSQLKQKEYDALLDPMTSELVEMARWVSETGQRVVVVFEGRDTAGKGGSIATVAAPINPRQCRIVALNAPSPRERSQWYFQRYIEHLPSKGEIVLFDRSWYNRAGVERVMGYCTEEEAKAFLCAVPDFERQLLADGVILFKYWLCCDQEKQEERFANRLNNRLKRWKLSPIDAEARGRYKAYTDAREAMLKATHTHHAPWTLVDFNDQRVGRLTLIRNLLDRLPDTRLPLPEIPWPPLPHKPRKERYGVLKPIRPFTDKEG
jgi:polyphosphate kinase 2